MPGKTRMRPSICFVDFADAFDVLEGALFVEAVGHGQVFGVVGDGDVLVAVRERGVGHFADGVVAVGGGGVHVHVAARCRPAR